MTKPGSSAVARQVRQTVPGIEVELVVGDLGTGSGMDALAARLEGRAVEVLVNNAGFGTYGRFSELDAGREHELVAVNVDALVRLTHAVLPGMLARGRGGILNVASTIAFQPGPIRPPTAPRRRLCFRSARRCGQRLAGRVSP